MTDNKRYIYFIALWLAAGSLAALIAAGLNSASFVDGQYIPGDNDAFYHARRILDAAIGERGFYQFDTMIHVPEGSWITWPWAYDYLMARALATWLWIFPSAEPMAFLAFVPLAWVFVNTGLMLAICRKIGLGLELSAIAVLAFILSPLTQQLHGVGMIDHHFIELSFVLATIWLGLGFFQRDSLRRWAVAYGFTLGIAPAFHNGLFILQLPFLFAAFCLWFQNRAVRTSVARSFCVALLVGTAAALGPSAPFRDLQFEFSTLSWFHLYIAGCTAICTMFFAKFPRTRSRYSLQFFIFVAALLAVPLLVKVGQGAAFVTGSTLMLDRISEVKSPLRMYLDSGAILEVTRYYSWLILISPFILLAYVVRIFYRSEAKQLFFACSVVFGLLLLLAQYRLHPFGYWALIIGPLVLVDDVRHRLSASRLAIASGCLLAVAIAFQPPLRNQLFLVIPAGLTRDYAATRSLYPVLAAACAEQPGMVLSHNDDGHPIRYHTDCSVIANNFLLTEQHRQKISEAITLLSFTPEQLSTQAPSIRYVFVRLSGLFKSQAGGLVPTPLQELDAQNSRLFMALLLRQDLPENFEILGELRVEDDRGIPFARVFRINHPDVDSE